jgi:hypothetical protein
MIAKYNRGCKLRIGPSNERTARGIPLRPDRDAVRQRNVTSLTRAALASARAVFTSDNNPAAIAARAWPNDEVAALLVKGAAPPATTASAAVLATTVIADLLSALGSTSAGGTLLGRGLQLDFGRAAAISIPSLIADANHGAFVGEGAPIPVYALAIGTPTLLAPHKLASLWSLTREMTEPNNAEALTSECMRRSLGLSNGCRGGDGLLKRRICGIASRRLAHGAPSSCGHSTLQRVLAAALVPRGAVRRRQRETSGRRSSSSAVLTVTKSSPLWMNRASRQTFVPHCHLGWTASEPPLQPRVKKFCASVNCLTLGRRKVCEPPISPSSTRPEGMQMRAWMVGIAVAIGLIWSVAAMSKLVPVDGSEMSLAAISRPAE